MKRKQILLAVTLLAAAALTTSCGKFLDKAMRAAMESISHDYQDSEKWGKVVSLDMPALPFHKVEISGAVRVEYRQDSIYSVQVYGNEKAIEAYAVSVDDEEIEASWKDNSGHVDADTPAITLRITAPNLSKIKGTGASEVDFQGDVRTDDEMELSFSGLAQVSIPSLDAKSLDLNIAGAGEVSLGDIRCTEEVEMEISGAGGIVGKIACPRLEVKLAGAATASLDIHTQKTKLSAPGASSITLAGETETLVVVSSGASSVDKQNLKVSRP